MTATLAPTHGLDALIQEIQTANQATVIASWSAWYNQAMEQLENDDAIDARYTDAFAESLETIDAAIAGEYSIEAALRGLVSLYYSHEEAVSVEARWRRRAAGLGTVQLDTGLWNSLNRALEAAATGNTAAVSHWIATTRATFDKAWTNYRQADVLVCEVTEESRAGHRLLGEGIANWLEALELFQAGLSSGVERGRVLSKAEAGQRLLVGLQVIQQEDQDCVDRFARAWSN